MKYPAGPSEAELSISAVEALSRAIEELATRLQGLASGLPKGRAARVSPQRLLILSGDLLHHLSAAERAAVVLEGICQPLSFLPPPPRDDSE